MNWEQLKQKANTYLEKTKPYVETAKTYGEKALDFTQKQLQNTPIVLKSVSEYNTLVAEKRFIIIGYDETDKVSQEVLLRSPVWSANAWSDNASLRFYTLQGAPDIAHELGHTHGVIQKVYYIWKETYSSTDIESIKSWWKDRCYDTWTTPDTLDPLA